MYDCWQRHLSFLKGTYADVTRCTKGNPEATRSEQPKTWAIHSPHAQLNMSFKYAQLNMSFTYTQLNMSFKYTGAWL